MLLASVNDILNDLGFEAMTDITASATLALDAAEAQLASVLNSEFDQGTFTDTFFVSEPPYLDGPACETEFRLRRGFVSSLTSVRYAGPVQDLMDPSAYNDVTATAQLHPDKGIVKDYVTRFRRQFVQIVYVAGFPEDGTNPASYDLTKVPDWLQQAAKTAALLSLADSPSLSEAQIKLDKTVLGIRYSSLINRKLRYAPLSLLPL